MAMKKDDDKSKRTLSGKKPATFGGAKSKLTASKPKSQSPVMVQSLPPIGRDASGSANFNRTAPSRATVSAGPFNISKGGKTEAPTGGRNLTGYEEKSQSNSTAKMSGSSTAPSTVKGSQNVLAKQEIAANRNKNLALGIAGTTLGAGIVLSGVGKKIATGAKKLVKYVAKTKERRESRKQQNADNEAFKAERKAKAEAKNPSTPIAKVKASKSTMKNIKRLKKGQ